MATNILPFESKTLPAYLRNVDPAALNDDLVSGGAGYPVISIKGKTFAIVRGGEREILPNPKDPDSPATSIDVVILKANPHLSKIYYAKKFEEGDDSKPLCYSLDGITPGADATEIQSPKCSTCKHNEWGSRISDTGKKGKACQDNKRIAVTTPDQLNEPYLMRVPPASLGDLTEYAQFLAKRGVKYNMVVTKISFDPEAATPKLLYKAVGLLDEAGYAQVQEALKMDILDTIVGVVPSREEVAAGDAATQAIKQVSAQSKAEVVPPKAEPVKAKVEPVKAKPEPVKAEMPQVEVPKAEVVIEGGEVEVNLDGLSFDD